MKTSRYLPMLSQSSLVRSVATYGFFSLINRVLPFLMLPVLTRYLTPDDYGLVSLFGVGVSLCSIFIGCNIDKAYFNSFYIFDKNSHPRYLGTTFIFVFLVTLFISFTIIVVPLEYFIPGIQNISSWFLVAIPGVAMTTVLMLLIQTAWQVRGKAATYGFFQMGVTSTELFVALMLIVCFGWGWQGRILSQIIAGIFFSIIGIAFLYKKGIVIFAFEKSCLNHGLRFGVPLIPHFLAGFLIVSLDKVFIGSMIGTVDVGIYSVGAQLGAVINLTVLSFDQAYHPWLFKKLSLNSQKAKKTVVTVTYCYIIAILFITFLFSFFLPIVLNKYIGTNFHDAFVYVFWIAFGYAFVGMYYMVAKYMLFTENTKLLSGITILSVPLNIILNFVFIRWNGALGAAQAAFLTHLLVFLATWYFANKIYPMPWTTFYKRNTECLD